MFFFFFLRLYLFMRDTEREKQAPCREPDMGLDPGSPGSGPGLKVALNRWATWTVVDLMLLNCFLSCSLSMTRKRSELPELLRKLVTCLSVFEPELKGSPDSSCNKVEATLGDALRNKKTPCSKRGLWIRAPYHECSVNMWWMNIAKNCFTSG